MKKGLFVLVCACLLVQNSFSQARLVNVKPKQFKISTGLKIQGSVGFLEVPENRKTVDSRKIQLKFVHLKSLSDQPSAPVIYLEGGGGLSTWEASSPSDLQDRLPLLKEADLIFLDRRGASDKKLTYLWKGDYPADFFASESTANQHYQKLAEAALEKFEQDKIDIFGYNVLAHAEDVNDLVTLLGLERFSIFGFSYGSHIGMTVMDLYPDLIERAILVGPDAPHQAFNYPSHLDAHIKKIGALVEEDPNLDMSAVEFSELVENVIKKLEESPAMVSVKHPQTKKKMDLSVGGFGLALILRLDIDDANDIPVIPRLLHSINTGDYAMLKWFLQKRMAWAVQFPGQGINQQIASGSSELRWSKIKKEAEESLFGNVVNFPFSALKEDWPASNLTYEPHPTKRKNIPTLFITGSLDCRTPIEQTEEIMKDFSNPAHVKVENAGHEQAQWDTDVADVIIPAFIRGEKIESTSVTYADIEFIPFTTKSGDHPSLK